MNQQCRREADALKEYRAACLLIPYYTANPPGDSPLRRLSQGEGTGPGALTSQPT